MKEQYLAHGIMAGRAHRSQEAAVRRDVLLAREESRRERRRLRRP